MSFYLFFYLICFPIVTFQRTTTDNFFYHYTKKTWHGAATACGDDYSTSLAKIDTPQQQQELKHVSDSEKSFKTYLNTCLIQKKKKKTNIMNCIFCVLQQIRGLVYTK